jgi:membrane protein implicated in regulation of membrane protease activity
MTKALQIKLLAVILAVLAVVAALLIRGGRSIEVTQQDRQLQQKLAQKVQPSSHSYVVP